LYVPLPMAYWQQQLKKCRNRVLRPFYEKALLLSTTHYNNHIVTKTNDNP